MSAAPTRAEPGPGRPVAMSNPCGDATAICAALRLEEALDAIRRSAATGTVARREDA